MQVLPGNGKAAIMNKDQNLDIGRILKLSLIGNSPSIIYSSYHQITQTFMKFKRNKRKLTRWFYDDTISLLQFYVYEGRLVQLCLVNNKAFHFLIYRMWKFPLHKVDQVYTWTMKICQNHQRIMSDSGRHPQDQNEKLPSAAPVKTAYPLVVDR